MIYEEEDSLERVPDGFSLNSTDKIHSMMRANASSPGFDENQVRHAEEKATKSLY